MEAMTVQLVCVGKEYNIMFNYMGVESRLAIQGKPFKFSSKNCSPVKMVLWPSLIQFKYALHYETGFLCENIPMNGTVGFNPTCKVRMITLQLSLHWVFIMFLFMLVEPVKQLQNSPILQSKLRGAWRLGVQQARSSKYQASLDEKSEQKWNRMYRWHSVPLLPSFCLRSVFRFLYIVLKCVESVKGPTLT